MRGYIAIYSRNGITSDDERVRPTLHEALGEAALLRAEHLPREGSRVLVLSYDGFEPVAPSRASWFVSRDATGALCWSRSTSAGVRQDEVRP